MSRSGPIILVEDDEEDQILLSEVLRSLNIPNELKCFADGIYALEFLRVTSEKPFLILCDVNMPRMNGFQLREEINSEDYLRKKSIPFIFLTTSTSREEVNHAYDLTVQGFFRKATRFDEYVTMIKLITQYWKNCNHPNNDPL